MESATIGPNTDTRKDIVIIGAGVIGLTLAYEILLKSPNLKILILEKERQLGAHASGRNSGVLHSGFYYYSDSLKAKLTANGNVYWREFCKSQDIELESCGKVVVASNQTENSQLLELQKRAEENDVKLIRVSSDELTEIEPLAKTYNDALYSPNTALFRPKEILNKLYEILIAKGVEFTFGQKAINAHIDLSSSSLHLNDQAIEYRWLINAAGINALKLIKPNNLYSNLKVIPFRGNYLKSVDLKLNCHIYPVPNLKFPFLGVHWTKQLDESVKIGPTASPAFWYEHYSKFDNFRFDECLESSTAHIDLFLKSNINYKKFAYLELRKNHKTLLTKEALKLLSIDQIPNKLTWVESGIRGQLYNSTTGSLVDDFLVENHGNTTHILNAVSPAFTCAGSLAKFVIKNNLSELITESI